MLSEIRTNSKPYWADSWGIRYSETHDLRTERPRLLWAGTNSGPLTARQREGPGRWEGEGVIKAKVIVEIVDAFK